MKVLMIPSGYYPECCGGVEVITQALSEGLVKKGHKVFVLCQSNHNSKETINGVVVYKMKPYDMKNLNNSRFKYKINRLLQMYNPFNKKRIREIIKEINPDIVNLHMARTLSMSVLKVVEDLDIPVISTLHEYFSLWNFDPFDKMENMLVSKPQWYVELIRNKHRKLTKKVNYITAPLTTTIKEYQKEGYYKDVQSKEILNALPVTNQKERLELANKRIEKIKERKKINYLIISRLMPFKGIEIALESFMNNKNENILLNIAGDGPLVEYVKECAKKDKRINYVGYVIGEEKDRLLRESDVLVFPTTELETYGLVIIEAYNYCMPVIANEVEATKRLIINDKTGVLLKNATVDSLSKAYNRYLDIDYLTEQIRNCYKYLTNDSYEEFIDNYEKLYLKVLKENKNESK